MMDTWETERRWERAFWYWTSLLWWDSWTLSVLVLLSCISFWIALSMISSLRCCSMVTGDK